MVVSGESNGKCRMNLSGFRLAATVLTTTSLMLVTASCAHPRIARLESDDWEVQEKAASDIREGYDGTVRDVIRVAEQTTPYKFSFKFSLLRVPAKYWAIRLLGDLRASEAVRILLDNLTYPNPMYCGSLPRDRDVYPSAGSLIEIGTPAVGPVTEKLRGCAEDDLERHLCVLVLKEILGAELAEAHLTIAIGEVEEQLPGERTLSRIKYLHGLIANLKAARELVPNWTSWYWRKAAEKRTDDEPLIPSS